MLKWIKKSAILWPLLQVLWTHWLVAGAQSFMEKVAAVSP